MHVPYTDTDTHMYLSVSPDRGSRMSRRNDKQTAVPRRPTIMLRTCAHDPLGHVQEPTTETERERERDTSHAHTNI